MRWQPPHILIQGIYQYVFIYTSLVHLYSHVQYIHIIHTCDIYAYYRAALVAVAQENEKLDPSDTVVKENLQSIDFW
jgi:hypothetical protein